MPLIDITAPAVEPVTATEVKAAARIDDTAFDAQIAIIIPAIRRLCETRLDRRLVTQTVELVLDAFPAAEIDLYLPDVQSITSVKYLDAIDGTEQTLASDQYSLDSASTPCWLLPAYDTDWPDTWDTTNAVRVRFVAGYGLAAAVPENVKLWILAHCVQALQSPEGLAAGRLDPLPYIDGLLDSERVLRFG